MTKFLFLTKYRENAYTQEENLSNPNSKPFSSGLYNSVKFINDMLNAQGHESVHESCMDNNDIDRLVTLHRPTHVVLEALWCVPEKLDVLKPLHPTVTWILRLHSEVPFLANEGIAVEWMKGYADRGAIVTANSTRMCEASEVVCGIPEIPYTPNYYPVGDAEKYFYDRNQEVLDIGCFGAIRPLKNHLIQAKAAMIYAERKKKTLNFHINGTRLEGNGDPVLKNLRALFEGTHHNIVEHDWLDHEGFLNLVSEMDAVMQVSFTETFNIVVADAITQNIPVVASKEIKFVAYPFIADPTNIRDIVTKLDRALIWSNWGTQRLNKELLRQNARKAIAAWNQWIIRLEGN